VVVSGGGYQLGTVVRSAGRERAAASPPLHELTGATAGNLSTHLRELEDAGDVAVIEDDDDPTRATRVRLPAQRGERLATHRRDLWTYLDGEVAAALVEPLVEPLAPWTEVDS